MSGTAAGGGGGSQGQGLRLTTNRIRSKGNSRKTLDLNKQLKGAFKMSVSNAKKRDDKRKESEKTLHLAMNILEKCELALSPVDYEGLVSSINELDRSYKELSKNLSRISNEEKEEKDEEKEEEKDRKISTETKNKIFLSLSSSSSRCIVSRPPEPIIRETKDSMRKTLIKCQTAFKKKLDRLTDTIRIMESTKGLINSLKKRALENERKTKEFKKQLCIDMKATFDPLFLGSIGYENGIRTDPYGDNLEKSLWDSKTSKA